MKRTTRALMIFGLILSITVLTGCINSSNDPNAAGGGLPFDPLSGEFTLGLAADFFGPSGPDSDTDPRSTTATNNTVVELFTVTFDEESGTVTLTSKECGAENVFDFEFFDCEGECDPDEEVLFGEIFAEDIPFNTCLGSEDLASIDFSGFFEFHVETSKFIGDFDSTVHHDIIEGDSWTDVRSGALLAMKTDTPPGLDLPSPVLSEQGPYDPFLFVEFLMNIGDSPPFPGELINLESMFDFDASGSVLALVEIAECIEGAEFAYVFDFDEDHDEGDGLIFGTFSIEDTCDGGSLEGLFCARIELDPDFDVQDFLLMAVGEDGEGTPFTVFAQALDD